MSMTNEQWAVAYLESGLHDIGHQGSHGLLAYGGCHQAHGLRRSAAPLQVGGIRRLHQKATSEYAIKFCTDSMSGCSCTVFLPEPVHAPDNA